MIPNDMAKACANAMWKDAPASRGLGICHAGFIFTLADSAMAFASNAHGAHAVAQHIAITHVRPGRLGERLVAEAEERVRGGRIGLYDVRVTGADGSVVAEMRGHTRLTGGKFFPEG